MPQSALGEAVSGQARARALIDLLVRAVEQWPQYDASQSGEDEVSGADLVEWFAEWRHQVKQLLLTKVE